MNNESSRFIGIVAIFVLAAITAILLVFTYNKLLYEKDQQQIRDVYEPIVIDRYVCTKCKGYHIYIDRWINPNTDEMANIIFDDSVYCDNCKTFTNYKIVKETVWRKK